MSRKLSKIPDPQDELIDALERSAPDEGLWQVSSTDELILSQVNYVLSTGIDAFDDEVGGMPFGRIVEVFGLENSGKSAMALRCAARARKKCIKQIKRTEDDGVVFENIDPEKCDVMVNFIDNEGSLDLDGKMTFEGEVIKIANFRCDTTENMLKSIDKTLDVAEARIEKYPDRKLFTVIVVDTIAATTTEKELKSEWGSQDYPRQPYEISRGLACLVRRVNVLNACLICTNQVRSTFKQGPKGRPTFGIEPRDYKSSGGYALRFYASHRVFVWSLDSKYKLVPTAKFPAGLQIGFYSLKNRIKKPLREGRMVLLFDKTQGGFNNAWSMLETMLFLGFIECKAKEKGCNFVLKFNKNRIIPETFGAAQVTTTLDEDDDVEPVARRSSRKDPEFKYRCDWPQFLEEHRADVDKLWAAAMAFVDNTDGLEGGIAVEEADDDAPPPRRDDELNE